MHSQSNSQARGNGVIKRAIYLWRLTLLYMARVVRPGNFQNIAADLDFYRGTYAKETGQQLEQAQILEVGFGQLPFRLMLLQSLGYNAKGIDLDRPLLRLDLSTTISIFKTNGPLRTIKSLVRRIAFDSAEYKKFEKFVSSRYGKTLRFQPDAMVVGSAADPVTWARAGGPFDFIYSEHVFEHIPRETISRVVDLIADALSDHGIAIITPNIFTGIIGGHDIGWYRHKVALSNVSRGPAWGHLTGESEAPDTFLNKMTRKEYRDLFRIRFVILQEQTLYADLGRNYLTAERRVALKDFDDDELFSNVVHFVLRKIAR